MFLKPVCSHSKGKNQPVDWERQSVELKKIFANHKYSKGLISKIDKEVEQLNTKKQII